jgi:diaminopimelate epimerase
MALSFSKYEGIGNDFIVVRGRDRVTTTQAVALCDRHLGVGADGVLMTDLDGDGRRSMQVINADGTTPEMCGNGLRCVALDFVRRGEARREETLDVATGSGVHRCIVFEDAVSVVMRAPDFTPGRVPVEATAPVVDATWDFGGTELAVTAVSLGNPHLVTFDDVGDRRRELAPRMQDDERLPERANVGFARVERLGDGVVIHLRVYERGAGWTRACGTGACAAVAAAIETGRAAHGETVQVRLPGGQLAVSQPAEGAAMIMTGPARHVFDGNVDLDRLRVDG